MPDYENMKEYNFLNGQILLSEEAKIHVSDLGLLRGYGIFDFFRAVNGKPVFMDDHLDRLENSARLMGLPIPESRERLKEIILELIELNPHDLLGIKVVMTGGYSPDGYTPAEPSNLMIIPKPFIFKPADIGMKLMTYEYSREIPEIKTLSYISPIRVLPKMREAGADDLLYHLNGDISESSRSNIFIIKDRKVITPKDGVLYGVTRKYVLELCREYFEVEERDVTLKETLEADEVFTTGSTKRVVAISQIDNTIFNDGKIGKQTRKIQSLFLERELL